jgi:hypothetical protein
MERAMTKASLLVPLSALVVLGGCVTVPTGPAVRVMPGAQKSWEQFQADDANCRQFAFNSIGGPNAGQPGQDSAAANAAVASAIGAAAGAAIGAVSGHAGPGAAIGAGTGLLFGSAAGANTAGYSSAQLQRSYDTAYLQCMYAHGNQVPGFMVSRAPRPVGPPVYSYPPQSYPPQGYPQGYSVPPAAPAGSPPLNYPPPNTPPPQTM